MTDRAAVVAAVDEIIADVNRDRADNYADDYTHIISLYDALERLAGAVKALA
ncbi:hypothetical protein [Mycolicibacterium sphagni]|uniref:hypothetical protein n=1 Tax=Mycolicibacterium sphagni TaxID=1786 RepID=UPI0021F2A655|nr:hypothetical protein [Mycolicibacterium sphagni]MCV7174861.1 hypothetical protein [Mycolicibacterium sphagni]